MAMMLKAVIRSPYFQPSNSDTASPRIVCAMIATCGVLCTGCVLANARGRTPLRPSTYITRDAAFTPAFEFASAELMIAAKISTQPPLQNTIPRSRPRVRRRCRHLREVVEAGPDHPRVRAEDIEQSDAYRRPHHRARDRPPRVARLLAERCR